MSKNKVYWTLQLFGWTTLIMFEYIPYTLEYGFDLGSFYSAIANILLAITLTHFYRLVIRRWNWSSLPLIKLAMRVVFSVLLLGLVMTFINLPLDRKVLEHNLVNQPLVFFGYYSSWCKNLLSWVLSYTVYHYVEQNRMAGYEKIMLKMSIRETESKVLRSQLNPHFTFNALNSIRALVFEDPNKAQSSITKLANILRNSLLADRRKTVDLQEELKTVVDYLELEKVRYEARLEYEIITDPQAIYWQLPPMMLQTLVENGIKHGVSKLVGGGRIEVISIIENDILVIKINNSGQLTATDSSGVGLKNTAERLSILYGKHASFTIKQMEENMVGVEVRIPSKSESYLDHT